MRFQGVQKLPKIAEVEITSQNLSTYPEAVRIRLNIEIGDTIEFWDILELWTDENRLLLVNRKRQPAPPVPSSAPDEWITSRARVEALKQELEIERKTRGK